MSETGASPLGAETMTPSLLSAWRYHHWIYRHFQRWVRGNVLEIGGGHGIYTEFLRTDAVSVTATDRDRRSIELMKSRVNAPNVTMRPLDVCDEASCQALGRVFDTVICLNVLEHIEEDGEAVRRMARLLASGGHLVLVVPAFQWLFSPLDTYAGHFRRYRKANLCGLLEDAGLRVVHHTYFNALGIPGWFVFGKLMRPKSLAAPQVNGAIYLFDKLMVSAAALLDYALFHAVGLSVLAVAQKSEAAKGFTS